MADQAQPAANPQAQGPSGQLAIQKIYVKDLSFEAPNTPGVFTEQLNPSVDIHISNDKYGVVLFRHFCLVHTQFPQPFCTGPLEKIQIA